MNAIDIVTKYPDCQLNEDLVRNYIRRSKMVQEGDTRDPDRCYIEVRFDIELNDQQKTHVLNIPYEYIEKVTNRPAKYILHVMYCITTCTGKLVRVGSEDDEACSDDALREACVRETRMLPAAVVRFVPDGPEIRLVDPAGCNDRVSNTTLPSTLPAYKNIVDARDRQRCVISGETQVLGVAKCLDRAHIIPSSKHSSYISDVTASRIPGNKQGNADPMYQPVSDIHDPRNVITLSKDIHGLCAEYNWGFALLRVPNEHLSIEDLKWNQVDCAPGTQHPAGDFVYMFHAFDKVFFPSKHRTFTRLNISDNHLVRPAASLQYWPTHALIDFWFGNVALLYWMDEDALVELVFAEHETWYGDVTGALEDEDEDEKGEEEEGGGPHRGYKEGDGDEGEADTASGGNIDVGRVVAWFYKSATHHRNHAASIARAATWLETTQ